MGNLCVDAEPVHDAGAGGPGGPRLLRVWWGRPALGLPHLPRPHRSAPAVLRLQEHAARRRFPQPGPGRCQVESLINTVLWHGSA